MEIKGKVVAVLPVQSGVSKAGKDWKKQSFILESSGKKVCLDLFGDKVGLVKNGESLTAHVDIDSREYQGKWYTNVNCVGVEKSQTAASIEDEGDSLPF